MLIRLLTRRVQALRLATPIILILRRIDVYCLIPIVVERHRKIQALGQQVALKILERGHYGVTFAVLLAIDYILTHTRLYILIHLRIVEAKNQTVGPTLTYYTHLGNDRLIVIGVVEALQALLIIALDTSRLKILDRNINLIVVIRLVLKGVYLPHKAVAERLSSIYR